MNADTPRPALEAMASAIADKARQTGALPDEARALYLAHRFEHDVTQGGFAQLIYNLQGDHLASVEQMLIEAPAPLAHAHYVQAIECCLADQEAYQAFLAGDYAGDNPLKDALHGVSIAYFACGVAFCDELRDYLQHRAPAVRHWLGEPV